jgi:Rad3-related DNA helicase
LTCSCAAGTGKTLIGVALARTLLAYDANTILVITYTNHALDQFLEAILDSGYCDEDLLRVGGRSSSERIEALSANRALDKLREPGAMQAPMMAPEKARNYALGQEVAVAREDARDIAEELDSVDWARPLHVPLLALENVIEV